MKGRRPTTPSAEQSITWQYFTERLARHIARLHRASRGGVSARSEIHRWRRELDVLQDAAVESNQMMGVRRDR
jgi:hypothetical protein